MVSVWVLDDHARTSHAREVLGAHLHTVPPVGRVRAVHAVPVRRHRVHDLLLWLDRVHRHGLRVPVLNRLHVRSVPVAVATSRDGDCGGGWVLHL